MRSQGLTHTLPPPDPTRHPNVARDHGWDRIRLGVLCCWLLLVVGVVALGSRASSLVELEDALDSGQVESVRVTGALPDRASGYAVVRLDWRQGPWRRSVEVVQVTPGTDVPGSTRGDRPVLRREIGARLLQEHPGLRVVRSDADTSSSEVAAWRIPSWLGLVELVLAILALCILVSGAEPWRATRWAWFWLMAVSGVGLWAVPAMLALSGPTPLLPTPRPGSRRLTGGWAFLVALLSSVVLGQHL